MLVVRLFFVLNVLIVYALGARLFGRVVGLGASLLTLSSFAFANASSFVLLDCVFPFFILLGIFLTVVALEGKGWAFPVLAGLSFALGFLTKEVALFYLIGLPPALVLVVRKYRSRRCALRAALILLVGLAAITPWAAHVWRSSGSFGPLLGQGAEKVIDTLLGAAGTGRSDAFSRVGQWILAVPGYFVSEIMPAFSIWPLVAFSWLVAVVLSVRSDRFRIPLLGGALFLPLVFYLGSADLRLGQGVLLFLITYILVSAVLWEAIRFLFVRSRSLARWSTVVGLSILLALAGIQSGVGSNSAASVWRDTSLVVRYLLGLPADWQTRGWHSPDIRELSTWLVDNLSPGTSILCDWEFGEAVWFLTEGQFKMTKLEVYDLETIPDGESAILLWGRLRRTDSDTALKAITENALLAQINNQQIQYVITARRRWFVRSYFDDHPSAVRKASFMIDLVRIYHIVRLPFESLPAFGPCIGDEVPLILGSLSVEDQQAFQIVAAELADHLEWPAEYTASVSIGSEVPKLIPYWPRSPARRL